jgi:outer membrane protein OmpA-like peptidoglycan-associated protein
MRAGLGHGLEAMLGAGTGIATESGFGRESFRVIALLRYERPFNDRDGDGIRDEDDQCPDVPEDRDGFEDSDGCPDPDNDGDGIPDSQDRCPDKPGPKTFEGCPDTDGDGVPDSQDRCPDEKGPKDLEGCPDSDGDEVPDVDDKCKDVAGPASDEGCPGKPLVVLEQKRLVIKGAINFDSGKASIKKESLAVLDAVAEVLQAHPEIKHVTVEGHTDNVGAAALNRDLSQRRAESVVHYLVGREIARERLEAKGFGEDRPIAPNDTTLGKAKNRRVEFTIVE